MNEQPRRTVHLTERLDGPHFGPVFYPGKAYVKLTIMAVSWWLYSWLSSFASKGKEEPPIPSSWPFAPKDKYTVNSLPRSVVNQRNLVR